MSCLLSQRLPPLFTNGVKFIIQFQNTFDILFLFLKQINEEMLIVWNQASQCLGSVLSELYFQFLHGDEEQVHLLKVDGLMLVVLVEV